MLKPIQRRILTVSVYKLFVTQCNEDKNQYQDQINLENKILTLACAVVTLINGSIKYILLYGWRDISSHIQNLQAAYLSN